MTDLRKLKKQQTCLLHVSSEYKQRGSNNGDFSIILGNSIKVKEAVKVVPVTITIPNVFPNIGPHNNKFEVGLSGGSGWKTVTLDEKQYSATEIALALTEKINDALNFSSPESGIEVTIQDSKLVVANNSTSIFLLQPAGGVNTTGDLFDILGLLNSVLKFQEQGQQISSILTVPPEDEGMLEIPVNLAPLQTVLVHSSVLAHSNAIGSDGRCHHIMDTVDLSNTPYGGTVCKQVYDSKVADIEYRTALELDNIDIRLTDTMNRPLSLPSNYNVHLTLRVYHGHNHK